MSIMTRRRAASIAAWLARHDWLLPLATAGFFVLVSYGIRPSFEVVSFEYQAIEPSPGVEGKGAGPAWLPLPYPPRVVPAEAGFLFRARVRIEDPFVLDGLQVVVDDLLTRLAVNGNEVFTGKSHGIGDHLDATVRRALAHYMVPGVNVISGTVVNTGGPTLLRFETPGGAALYGSDRTRIHFWGALCLLTAWFALYRISPSPSVRTTVLILLATTLLFFRGFLSTLRHYGRSDWDVHFSFVEAVRRSVVEYGELPLWNPYSDGGVPLLGYPESMALSPLLPLTWALGTVVGAKLLVILHAWIGMVGMFLLGRYLKLRWEATLVGAVLFQFNGAIVQHMAEGHLPHMGVNWVPWSLLFFFRSRYHWDMNLLLSGLFLAAVMLTGNVYTLVFTVVGMAAWCVLESVRTRTARPVLALGGWLATFGVLSAPKTLPVLEYGLLCARRPGTAGGFNFDLLWTALTGREPAYFRPGQVVLWHEYASYVGELALALAAVGAAVHFRRVWPAVVTLGLLVWLSLASFAPIDMWALLRQLPFISSLHTPSRWNYAFLFVLIWFTALGVHRIGARLPAVGFFVPCIIFLDLLIVGSPLYEDTFRLQAAPPPAAGEFRLVRAASASHLGRYSGQFELVSRNIGIRDSYNPVAPVRYAVPEGSPEYRGLVFLETTEGSASVLGWTPRRVRVQVNARSTDALVYNQNYFPGWNAYVNGERRRAFPVQGLVATTVHPGEGSVLFVYEPALVKVGFCVTAVALLAAACAWVASRAGTLGRSPRFRLGWSLAAGAAVVASAELAARVWGDAASVMHVRHQRVRLSENPALLYELAPYWSGEFETINPLGFRGSDVAREKPPGVFRVVCVGGSFTFGAAVDEQQTYPRILETKLQAEVRDRGGSSRVEVLNLGVPAYRPVELVQVLRRALVDLDADVIVLAIGEPFAEERRILLEQLGERADVDVRGLLLAKLGRETVIARLMRHSHFGTLVLNRVRQARVVLGERAPLRLAEFAEVEDGVGRHTDWRALGVANVAKNVPVLIMTIGASPGTAEVLRYLNVPEAEPVRTTADFSGSAVAHRRMALGVFWHPGFLHAVRDILQPAGS
jgi:hypothetical protein